MIAVAVGLAGAVGALLRHGIGVFVGSTTWPWPTLGINVLGSFLLALVATWGAGRWPGVVTTAVGTGLLGAFTTYSTFSLQTVTLVRDGRLGAAGAYVLASVVLGIGAAAAGLLLGALLLDGE